MFMARIVMEFQKSQLRSWDRRITVAEEKANKKIKRDSLIVGVSIGVVIICFAFAIAWAIIQLGV